jgi:hypothetical protein
VLAFFGSSGRARVADVINGRDACLQGAQWPDASKEKKSVTRFGHAQTEEHEENF